MTETLFLFEATQVRGVICVHHYFYKPLDDFNEKMKMVLVSDSIYFNKDYSVIRRREK